MSIFAIIIVVSLILIFLIQGQQKLYHPLIENSDCRIECRFSQLLPWFPLQFTIPIKIFENININKYYINQNIEKYRYLVCKNIFLNDEPAVYTFKKDDRILDASITYNLPNMNFPFLHFVVNSPAFTINFVDKKQGVFINNKYVIPDEKGQINFKLDNPMGELVRFPSQNNIESITMNYYHVNNCDEYQKQINLSNYKYIVVQIVAPIQSKLQMLPERFQMQMEENWYNTTDYTFLGLIIFCVVVIFECVGFFTYLIKKKAKQQRNIKEWDSIVQDLLVDQPQNLMPPE